MSMKTDFKRQNWHCVDNIAESLHSHPLTVEQWEIESEGDVDRICLLHGLTYGLEIIDDVERFPVRMSNYKSATDVDVKRKVEKQIIAELDAGNYVITKEPPTLIGALSAIPEPESEEVRLIHDCSRPKNNSLNSHITESERFSYQTIDDALKHIKHNSSKFSPQIFAVL